MVGAGTDELRVEVLGFGAVAEVENIVTVASSDSCLAWTASEKKNLGAKKYKDGQAQSHARIQQAFFLAGKTVFTLVTGQFSAVVSKTLTPKFSCGEGMDVVRDLAVGERGIFLERCQGFGFPEHAAEGLEKAPRKVGLHNVAKDR